MFSIPAISLALCPDNLGCSSYDEVKKTPVPEEQCKQNSDLNEGLIRCGRKINCEYQIITEKDKEGFLYYKESKNIIRTADPSTKCDFNAIMDTINRIINFVLFGLSIPIVAIMVAYAGVLYLFSGVSDQKSKAKEILSNAVIGLVIAFCAYIIIHLVLKTLGYNGTWIGF